MKNLLIILIIILKSISLFSQNTNENSYARNTIFFELGGNGGIYSINYDRIFIIKHLKFSIRAGMSFFVFKLEENKPIKIQYSPRFPIQLNLLIGKRNNYFVVGYGGTPYWYNDQSITGAFFPNIGYRYQRDEGGTFYKIEFSPCIFDEGEYTFIPWGSLGIGRSF